MNLALGLISGTSMDGIDAALVSVEREQPTPEVVAFRTFDYDEQTRVLLRRCQREGRLEMLARLDGRLGERFANAVGLRYIFR